MADTELIVYFTGLCGFAPEKSLSPCTGDGANPNCPADNRVRVSLVNGDRMDPIHVATLVIKSSLVDSGQTDRAHTTVYEDPNDPARVFWRFDLQTKERVTFHPTSHLETDSGALAIVNGLVNGDPICPTADDYRDIHWLLHMRRLGHGDGRMRQDCLDRPDQVPQLVKGQFILDEGLLETADFSRDTHGNVLLWEGIRPNGTVARRQALADLIQWTKTVDRPPWVQFERKERGAWVPKERITLQGSSPMLEVKNVPAGVLCGETMEAATTYEDPHFHHMFHLMRQPADADHWEAEKVCEPGLSLAPVGDLCRPLEVRFNDPQCPGGWFA